MRVDAAGASWVARICKLCCTLSRDDDWQLDRSVWFRKEGSVKDVKQSHQH